MTLLELQRNMASAIMAPLGRGDHLAPCNAASFIKPNSRLNARERLEIYARSYWYRLLDGLADDFPGLRAILGPRAFDKLARAYLADLPSESFTLRDLGSRLAAWLPHHAEYGGRNLALAHDMVRLEWAHVEAFDGPSEPALGAEDLLELTAAMTLRLQPHISLLALQYPVDDLHVSVSELAEGHGESSNAALRLKQRRAVRRHALKPAMVYVAVHRIDNAVYYRRMEADEYQVLEALRAGRSISDALDAGFAGSPLPLEEMRSRIESWFSAWAEGGWFCQPGDTPQ